MTDTPPTSPESERQKFHLRFDPIEVVINQPTPMAAQITQTPPKSSKDTWKVRIHGALDWTVGTFERVLVLILGLALIGWLVLQLVSGKWSEAQEVHPNWMVLLLLSMAMFYRTIRIFLENVREAYGMKIPIAGADDLNGPPPPTTPPLAEPPSQEKP